VQYPTKNTLTGGWAGGEAGLNALIDQIKAEGTQGAKPKPYAVPAPPKSNSKPIYVGFGKSDDEFKLRSGGGVGRVVYDSEDKYPERDWVVGGFAGGERGIEAFVKDGEVKVRKLGQVSSQPGSPITTGFTIIIAGVVGGLLVSVASPGVFDGTKGTVEELGINFAIGGVLFGALAGGAMWRSAGVALANSFEEE
jgi:hypothetical protein